MIMKTDAQAARNDAIDTLREKKIQDAMDRHGLNRKEAEALVGLNTANNSSQVSKRTPTAADTALVTIEALSENGSHLAIAKFLETPEGRELYASYANQPPVIRKRKYADAFNVLVDVFAKEHGNRWRAINDLLKTKVGADLYRDMVA